jgi:hypothetical protein
MSLDSSVSKANGYRLENWGLITSRDRDFSYHHHTETNPGVHPASCPVGTGSSFHGGGRGFKWLEYKFEIPLSRAEVKIV